MKAVRNSEVMRIIHIMLIVILFCPFANGKVIYVDDDATGANSGVNWENAYVYLQDALADANDSEKPVEIRVGQGTYTPDCGNGYTRGDKSCKFLLKSGVMIKGGFAGVGADEPNAWDSQAYETVLSGDLSGNDERLLENFVENSDHVIWCIEGDASAVLEGFIITGGYATGRIGGGLLNYEANPTVKQCVFFDNYASQGGGMANRYSSPRVSECTFSGNLVRYGGGGMYNTDQSHPVVESCIFHDNRSTILGGGGMYCGDSNPTVTHCLFIDNSAPFGGGMYNAAANPIIGNCTFSNNRSNSWGGGMQNEAGAVPIVTHCILWDNIPDGITTFGTAADVTYSNIQGGHVGDGNMDIDPLFANPKGGDYHLKSQAGRWEPVSETWIVDDVTSPCIDAGDPNESVSEEPVPNGGIINMGAYGGTIEASKSLSSVDTENGGGPVKPNFAAYYEPWEYTVEPNTISYELPLDLNKLTNYDQLNKWLDLDQVKDLIVQNGFVIIEHDLGAFGPGCEDVVSPYEYLPYRGTPMFVTADTFLHLYHIQFDETLKEIEEQEFYDDILMLTNALLNDALQLYETLEGDLKEAARRNVAYLAVAGQLIGSSSPVPGIVSGEVSGELTKIQNHSGFQPSNIFIYKEDYSQYVPRGHYTRSEKLKRYFKTLMWYGRMAFLLKGHENWGQSGEALINPYNAKIQTLQACLLAISLNTQQVENRSASEVWDRVYTVTAFYVGLADDLTPYDYLWALDRVFDQEYVLTDLADPDHFHEIKSELALLPAPKIFGGTGDPIVLPPVTDETLNEILDKTKGMRFMGQRFIPDSYMFQNLVAPQVGKYIGDLNNLPFTLGGSFRSYPRGLDIMAVLGSAEAKAILIQEGDTDYEWYWDRFNELAEQFGAFSGEDWNRNLYWGWLYSLQSLISGYGEGYPAFMKSPAWSKRSLNAALASWTELRHDTILYAKQSYSEPPFSGPGTPPCYVEPVPEFFGRLLALSQMTRIGLNDMAVLSEEARERLVNFEEMLSRLIEIVSRELTNLPLLSEDRAYLGHLATRLEDTVMTVPQSSSLRTTLVADVHTYGLEQTVLEEGVGFVDVIVVACPQPDGSAFLAAGPVLSYYEFKHPMADRLTDEKWRELLDSPNKPERPAWYSTLMR